MYNSLQGESVSTKCGFVSLSLGLIVPCGTLTLRVFFLLPSFPFFLPHFSLCLSLSLSLCQAILHGPAPEFSGIFHGRIMTSLSHASHSSMSVLVAPAVDYSIVFLPLVPYHLVPLHPCHFPYCRHNRA